MRILTPHLGDQIGHKVLLNSGAKKNIIFRTMFFSFQNKVLVLILCYRAWKEVIF